MANIIHELNRNIPAHNIHLINSDIVSIKNEMNTSTNTIGTKLISRKRNNNQTISKRDWTKEEDDFLISFIKSNKINAWREISKLMPNKTPVQCRYRWFTKLSKQSATKLLNLKSDSTNSLISVSTINSDINEPGEVIESNEAKGRIHMISRNSTKSVYLKELKKLKKSVEFTADVSSWTLEKEYLLLNLYKLYGEKWNHYKPFFNESSKLKLKTHFRRILKFEKVHFIKNYRSSANLMNNIYFDSNFFIQNAINKYKVQLQREMELFSEEEFLLYENNNFYPIYKKVEKDINKTKPLMNDSNHIVSPSIKPLSSCTMTTNENNSTNIVLFEKSLIGNCYENNTNSFSNFDEVSWRNIQKSKENILDSTSLLKDLGLNSFLFNENESFSLPKSSEKHLESKFISPSNSYLSLSSIFGNETFCSSPTNKVDLSNFTYCDNRDIYEITDFIDFW